MVAYRPENQSILFKDWCILALYEYAYNKIIASTERNCLFIIVDFIVVKFIDGNHLINDKYKFHPTPLAKFDEEYFPFILLTGKNCVSIVNVRDGILQPLID